MWRRMPMRAASSGSPAPDPEPVPASKRLAVTRVLRLRILRALQNESLAPGDALPSTRELARELGADPRVVSAAYRELAKEGLVEVRARSGIYVSNSLPSPAADSRPTADWLVEILAGGIERGVPAQELARTIEGALGSGRLRAAVIAPTMDQTFGIRRELETDFGLETAGVLPEEIAPPDAVPRAVYRAHILVTTSSLAEVVRRKGARLGRPVLEVAVRPDLLASGWQLLREVPSYVLVADPKFADAVAHAFAADGSWPNVQVLVAGRDDLSVIGDECPVYATQAARERVGRTALPAGVMPPTRMLSPATARELLGLMLAGAKR